MAREALEKYKLEDRVYHDEYLFLCKDKLPAKKRNFDTFRVWQAAQQLDKRIEQRTKSICSAGRHTSSRTGSA